MKLINICVLTGLSLALIMQLLAGDWGDALDGAVIVALYAGWAHESQENDQLREALKQQSRWLP